MILLEILFKILSILEFRQKTGFFHQQLELKKSDLTQRIILYD